MADRRFIEKAVTDGNIGFLRDLHSRGERVLLDQEPELLTALHVAAAAGHKDIVEFLLASGADPKALHANKFTPLHAAAMHGYAEIVKLILQAGANPNAQTDPQKYAPLHSAAWGGHTQAATELLAGGALTNLRNQRGETPAETARRNRHLATAEHIEKHAAITASKSPLITSFSWGRIEDSTGRTFKDARLFPGGSQEWDWGKTGTRHNPGVQIADIKDLLSLRPRAVIFTRGVQLALQVPERTIDFVRAQGPEVLILQSEAGVEEYNRRAKNELVVALIHSTC